MRLRSALASAIKYALLGAGVTVAATRLFRARAGELEPPLPGTQHTFRWRGLDVAYVAAGDESDPTLVLLHGVNAVGSAGEWREVFSELAADYRVIAPDLPGFGCSDRPPLRYSPALYEDFLADFLEEFDEPAVVASSLTGAYVAGAGDRLDLASLTLVCPTANAGPSPPKPWLRELLRAPVLGDALFGLLTSRPAILYFEADHGYWDPERRDEEWSDYEWRAAHQGNARFAPASFISGHLASDVDLADALRRMDAPVTLVWGREADLPPLSAGRELAEEAGVELVVFDRARLLPHVEYPGQFVATVRGERPEAEPESPPR